MQKTRLLMGCIFCNIMSGSEKSSTIFEDEESVCFLDRYPIDVGHCLLVPKVHHEKITDMDAADVGRLFSKVPKIAQAVLEATGASAFSLGQNNGRAAKQIIGHVHVHIIPRHESRGTVWTKRNIADTAELDRLAEKIRSFLG